MRRVRTQHVPPWTANVPNEGCRAKPVGVDELHSGADKRRLLVYSSTPLVVTRRRHGPFGTSVWSTNCHEMRSRSPSNSANPKHPLSAGDASAPAPPYRMLVGRVAEAPK